MQNPKYDRVLDLNTTQGNPSDRARLMIKKGEDPDTKIVVFRASTLCFTAPTTLGAWAGLCARERSNGKLAHFRKTPK